MVSSQRQKGLRGTDREDDEKDKDPKYSGN